VESGPTALLCSAELQVPVSDGYGTVKTMSGPRCTVNIRRDGYTSMLAKKHGTSRGFMQKVSMSLQSALNLSLILRNRLGQEDCLLHRLFRRWRY
jgi:hypothetical protein